MSVAANPRANRLMCFSSWDRRKHLAGSREFPATWLEVIVLRRLTVSFDVRSRRLHHTVGIFPRRTDGIDTITNGH
jgi:hypothetical protein